MSLKRFRPAFKENGVIGRYKREESLFYIYIYVFFFFFLNLSGYIVKHRFSYGVENKVEAMAGIRVRYDVSCGSVIKRRALI